ncbi:hypothetical protein ACFQE1_20260, partial [Halobium palmae]
MPADYRLLDVLPRGSIYRDDSPISPTKHKPTASLLPDMSYRRALTVGAAGVAGAGLAIAVDR